MKLATREWIAKAEDDFRAAGKLSKGGGRLHDPVCFHCQQCAEKYLKALLEEINQAVPKTHDLELLLHYLSPTHSSLWSYKRGLSFLAQFAIDSRYPGFDATKRQAEAALRWAGRVRDACRTLLGFRPTRP
ncbi:MAG TPA: HEPN domain-containing protein [Gemmataceae bacterium]|jgi:HEPN domain-containing protein|nr:HEPN domain-containing protein [Gemmataceae bacterium]